MRYLQLAVTAMALCTAVCQPPDLYAQGPGRSFFGGRHVEAAAATMFHAAEERFKLSLHTEHLKPGAFAFEWGGAIATDGEGEGWADLWYQVDLGAVYTITAARGAFILRGGGLVFYVPAESPLPLPGIYTTIGWVQPITDRVGFHVRAGGQVPGGFVIGAGLAYRLN